MNALQPSKGQAGERELAAEIHAATGWTVKRRVRQDNGDSDLAARRHERARSATVLAKARDRRCGQPDVGCDRQRCCSAVPRG